MQMNKTLPKPKKTKRKFYNKYIYKVSLCIDGINMLRYGKMDEFSDRLDFTTYDRMINRRSWHKESDEIATAKETISFLAPQLEAHKQEAKYRFEGDVLDIYTNEIDFYNNICNKFKKYVFRRFQPPVGTEQEILASKNKIFVKHLPHQKFEYKVYLKPHKLVGDRQKLIQWLYAQGDKTSFSDSIADWIAKTTYNWDRRYINVVDEPTILMLRLRCPEIVGTVQQYIVK